MVPAHLVQKYFGLDGVDRKELVEWSFWNQYDVFHNQPFDLKPPEQFKYIVGKHSQVTEKLVFYIGTLLLRKSIVVLLENIWRALMAPVRFLKALLCKIFHSRRPAAHARRHGEAHGPLEIRARGGLPAEARGRQCGRIADRRHRDDLAGGRAGDRVLRRHQQGAAPGLRTKAAAPDPAAFDAMVWEALRFVPISPYMFRQASEDYSVAKGTKHETLIRKGTNVLVLSQSAMFDTYAYDNPDLFNPNRNWYHNFNFGFGSHECSASTSAWC